METKGFAQPRHRCSSCLEIVPDLPRERTGIIYLVSIDSKLKWFTACGDCLSEDGAGDDVKSSFNLFHYSTGFTADIQSVSSAINFMHKFSLDSPHNHLWTSQLSTDFFTHLGMYDHRGVHYV